ncbi:hypothetical protein HMPREF1551_01557 [Capnocytophaga sp. oral taxon 863 str. F0517]|jgi:putative uncharacterized protein (fragment)|uniref:hypothetical protein n=1 Tax=Capnocytophaga sp. oral taxon 863 TaxID=1227265 RepID=UPI000397E77E|nr:hypothetical protein [Capnocytophaga sp. oral taxon 863]ERI63154.1 hypothetical protein HMPREF1551_01557 [Capnocytophaga sp. oral taxon 863 str. F0517]
MDKEQFLKEAQDKISALTEKISTLTESLGLQTGDLKEKAQEEINKLLADKSSLTEKLEALKNLSGDKWEEAKDAFNEISSGNISDGIQKGINSLKNLF